MNRNWLISILLALVVLAGALAPLNKQTARASKQSAIYYVAPDGNDAYPGLTLSQPWRTIQHAADILSPGDTVYVRGRTYNEAVSVNVSGSANDGYITFRNYDVGIPVLDGTGLTDPGGDNAFYIAVQGQSRLIIQGFEIRNGSLRFYVVNGVQTLVCR